MPNRNDPYTIYDRGWIVRIQPPQSTLAADQEVLPRMPLPGLLLLHGWTGDETVMWIFTRGLQRHHWIFAPRAPVQAPEGGYGWLPNEGSWPELADFQDTAGKLLSALQRWARDVQAPGDPFDVMGFSQGAAMAYALAAYYPQQINRLVALSGFLPLDELMPGRYSALSGKKIYVAHGIKDRTVPVQKAQEAVQVLRAAGARVTYCEGNASHKLSAKCLKGLEVFLA